MSFIWIQTHRIFPSHGGYLLSTLQVPGVGFSVAGLDRAKFGFYWFHFFFVYCCHSDIDFTKYYILTNFNQDQFVVKISRLKSFKSMSVWSPKNCRNNRRRYLLLLLYHACFPVLLSFGKSLYRFLTLSCFKFRLWGKEYY